MEILIYGLEQGENRAYMESLLSTQCKTASEIQAVIKKAKAHGFHSFRVTTYNGEAPDFVATLTNIGAL